MVPTPQVQDPSVKVPAVTYLPEDQVSVPQEELSAALEEGKSLLQQSFTLLKAKFEGLCGDLGNHGPFIGADACTVTEQSVCVPWWVYAFVCLDGGFVWFAAK